jgi:hypothetical protein
VRHFIVAAALLAVGAASAEEITCQTVRNVTYCSDGTTIQRNGNLQYITPPPSRGQPYQLPMAPAAIPGQPDTRIPLMVQPPTPIGQPRDCGYLASGQYVCR